MNQQLRIPSRGMQVQDCIAFYLGIGLILLKHPPFLKMSEDA